jgi:hypothetical protein
MGESTESDPKFTSRYMNQFAEMIERDRSHPCVIIWSLGNESAWGSNFQKEHDYAKQEDTTRPIIFSYPESVPKGTNCYDIFSYHYPEVGADLSSKEFPKLNDEYAHVSCYNVETLKRDPGVRNYWGHSLKLFWENCYAADGCLGGAIWAGFDEVFMLPGSPVGYGEWGILDGWRRAKPEYWLTKKAYSPVRILDEDIHNVPAAGAPLAIPIKNWFNHTNLREIKIVWAVSRDSGEISGVNLAPGKAGILRVPGRDWKAGETVNLTFCDKSGMLVDEFNLRIGERRVTFPAERGPAPNVRETTKSLTVQGADFTLVFDKVTGLIAEGMSRGKRIIEGGPVVSLGSLALPPWWLTSLTHSTTSDAAIIKTAGAYMALRGGGDDLGAEFEIRVDGQGLITVEYTLLGQRNRPAHLGPKKPVVSLFSGPHWPPARNGDERCQWNAGNLPQRSTGNVGWRRPGLLPFRSRRPRRPRHERFPQPEREHLARILRSWGQRVARQGRVRRHGGSAGRDFAGRLRLPSYSQPVGLPRLAMGEL